MATASDSDVRHIAEASQKLNYPGANKIYSHLKANSQYVQYKHMWNVNQNIKSSHNIVGPEDIVKLAP